MKILILGATGRTGKLVLQKALKQGYAVHCLARNSQRIQPKKGLTIFEGSPTNENDLKKALSGCDTVIGALNISRRSDFPWAALRTPKTLLSDTMSQLVPLCEEQQIKHITICSAWGTAESKKDLPGWFRWFIDNSNIGIAYKDHERQEKILSASKVNFTIVCPVGLTNSKRKEFIKESFDNNPKPGLLISRASVAAYLLESPKKDHIQNKKVVISKK